MCHGIFPLFYENWYDLSPKNNNKWYIDILHDHGTPWPVYKSECRQIQSHLILWRQKGRSVNICWHDFNEWIFTGRLCSVYINKLFQNVLLKTVAWLFVWELIQISHGTLTWLETYNANSDKLQLNLILIEMSLKNMFCWVHLSLIKWR